MKSIGYLLVFAVIIFSSCHSGNTKIIGDTKNNSEPALINSLDEFKARFNKVDYLMPITKVEIQDGAEINTFQSWLSENLLIDGKINKSTNTVMQIRMVTKESDDATEGAQSMFAMVGLIKAADTTLDNKTVEAMIDSVRRFDDQGNILPSTEYDRNSIRYITDYNDSLKIIYFTIIPASS